MDVVNASRSAVEGQIKQLQEKIKKNRYEVGDSVAKRVKRERPPEFHKKKQYLFNDKVLKKVDEAIAGISSRTPSLEAAKKALEEGKSLIEERQKMIHLADRSEYGWEVVNEYQSNELAVDSGNEKRILKVKKAVERKVPRKRKANTGGSKGKASNTKFGKAAYTYRLQTSSWQWSGTAPIPSGIRTLRCC